MKAAVTEQAKIALAALNHFAYLVAAGGAVGYGIGMGLMLAVKVIL